MKVKEKIGLVLTLTLIIGFTTYYSIPKKKLFTKTGFYMDTYFEIKLYHTNSKTVNEIFNKVFNEISRIEDKFSIYKEESIVSKINKNKNCAIDEETFNLISESIFISSITSGAFDITILPLVKLWNIKSDKPEIPSLQKISLAKKSVDYKKIVLEKENGKYYIKLLPPLEGVDLGGIAKGHAIKSVLQILNRNNINTYLINAGGGIYCKGKKWIIGLQHPRKNFGEIYATLPLQNLTISTSGDYERFFIKNGKRYHHIINPSTGFPAENQVCVSVIVEDPIIADGLSTALFITGENFEVINKLKKMFKCLEYIIVDENLNVYKSNGLSKVQTHL